MKKIFLLIVLVVGFISAFAQSDDSTKYIYYRYTYGNRMPRFRTDSIQTIPRDTAHNANYGSVAVKNNLFYIKDSTKWTQASADLSVLPYVTWENKSGFDSLVWWRPTPKEFRVKAIRINGASKVITDSTIDYTVTPGFTNPMTTAGDIIYGLAAGAAQRLGAGTSAQTLHGGTVPSWGSVNLTLDVGGTLQIGNGGTGQGTANNALNALLPSQTSNSGKVLQTDGTNTSWQTGGGSPNASIGTGFRSLIDATQEMRKFANGFGVNWDSVSTANSLTAKVDTSANKIPTQYFVTGAPLWPAEKPLGTIYKKSYWDADDLKSDFLPNPSGTLTVTLNNGKPVLSASVGDYNQWTRVIPWFGFNSNRWRIYVEAKKTAHTAGTNWFTGGKRSYVEHDGAQFGEMFLINATTSNAGTTLLYDQTGSANRATSPGSSGPAWNLNDVLRVTFDMADSVLTITTENITTASGPTAHTYSYPSNQTVVLPNVGSFFLGYVSNAGASGTIEIQSLELQIPETQNASVMFKGNSKTEMGYADNWFQRFGFHMKSAVTSSIINAGSAERTGDMLYGLSELQALHPAQVVLCSIWDNDIRAGIPDGTIKKNIKLLHKVFEDMGTRIWWEGFPEDSTAGGVGTTAFYKWMQAEWPTEEIPTWSALRVGTSDNRLQTGYSHGDGVHLNGVGNDTVYNRNIQYIFSVPSHMRQTNKPVPTRNFYTGSHNSNPKKDALPKWDSLYNQVPSVFQDNGVTAFVSTSLNPTAPAINGRLNVEGALHLYGTQGQIKHFDATFPGDNYTFQYDAHVYRTLSNGSNVSSFDNTGKHRIGPVTTGTYTSAFQIKQDYNFGYTSGFNGLQLQIGATTHNYTGNTALPDISTAYIDQATLTANGATSYPWASSLHIKGAPILSTNTSATNGALALYVEAGMTYAKGGFRFDLGSDANYDLYYRNTSGLLTRLANGTTGQVLTATTSAAPSWTTPTTLATGTYTPTLTAVANVAASTSALCYYYRIGTEVTVYGTLQIDPTAATTLTQIGLSIPVASTFTTSTQAAGTFAFNNGEAGIVISDASNGRAELQFTPTTGTNRTYWFHFSYHVQ